MLYSRFLKYQNFRTSIIIIYINNLMQALNTFISLVSKTEGRDKVLRLVQYACLYAVDKKERTSTLRVYEQMRMTRKMLRFLRTLDFSFKIRAEIPELLRTRNFLPMFFRHLTGILQNLFTFLFFISDHIVCLSQLDVLSKEKHKVHYPRSMKFFFLQNVFGIFNDIFCIIISIIHSKDSKDLKKLIRAVKHYSFDIIRCLSDCIVALYYWKKATSAKVAGILGVITSIMGIMQSLQKM